MALLTLSVLEGGQFTTVQDAGRKGFRKFGIPTSGAMDKWSMRAANSLLGNPVDAAVLECTYAGGRFHFDQEASIALVGAQMPARLNGKSIALHQTLQVPAGGELILGRALTGCRTYLAIGGELQLATTLGSYSTYPLGEFGGHKGRPLKAGDQLQWQVSQTCTSKEIPEHRVRSFLGRQLLRFLPGPEWEQLPTAHKEAFLKAVFTLSPQSNRMGIRLEPQDSHLSHQLPQLASGPTFPGTVQLPEGGKPIVLTADGQTTGGYPRIAQVIAADIDRLSQIQPGGEVGFVQVSMEEALALRQRQFLSL